MIPKEEILKSPPAIVESQRECAENHVGRTPSFYSRFCLHVAELTREKEPRGSPCLRQEIVVPGARLTSVDYERRFNFRLVTIFQQYQNRS